MASGASQSPVKICHFKETPMMKKLILLICLFCLNCSNLPFIQYEIGAASASDFIGSFDEYYALSLEVFIVNTGHWDISTDPAASPNAVVNNEDAL